LEDKGRVHTLTYKLCFIKKNTWEVVKGWEGQKYDFYKVLYVGSELFVFPLFAILHNCYLACEGDKNGSSGGTWEAQEAQKEIFIN
jgi:hypothetical protein